MSTRDVCLLLFFLLFVLSACNRTTGSHTTAEQQRLSKLHSHLSFEFMLNRNLNVALGEAEEALRLNENGVEANHAMARVQELLGRPDQVDRHYLRALKTDPYSVVVLNDYGQYLCRQGKVKQAFEKFERAGSQLMEPQRMVSYTRAATCAMDNLEIEKSEKYLLKALELNPQSLPVLLNLARASYYKNDLQKAGQYLRRYFAIEAKPSPAAIDLANKIQQTLVDE